MIRRLDSVLNGLAKELGVKPTLAEASSPPTQPILPGPTSPDKAEISPAIYLEGFHGLPIRTVAMAIKVMRRLMIPGDRSDALMLQHLLNARTPDEYKLAAEAFRNWADEEGLLRDPPDQLMPI